MTVVLADYGAGNLRSVCSAFERAGARTVVSAEPGGGRGAPRAGGGGGGDDT
jgi:imidazoleglycerol phosphate synthase glutamine amidotransferase subunit HisH